MVSLEVSTAAKIGRKGGVPSLAGLYGLLGLTELLGFE